VIEAIIKEEPIMKNTNDVVIVAAARTPIGKFGEAFRTLRAHELAARVITELLKRANVPADLLDDVILGDCVQCPDEANTARTAALKAGVPVEVPAVTIQRQCSSAMAALAFATQQIKSGDSQFVLAGGVESMSSAPYVLRTARWGQRLTHGEMTDAMWEMLHSGSNLLEKKGYIMGQTAENLAEKYNISRQDQDIVALRSHNNVERATKDGAFKEEIVPIELPQKKGKPPLVFDKDEHFRPGLTLDDLAKLPPAFLPKIGKVTAGNASGINDGASAMVIMSAEKAKELGLKPIARIKAVGRGGCHPSVMGLSPVPAVQDLLTRNKMNLKDFELIEVNEAFAAQYLGCERELGLNREITNVNGSGCGLGHPVGSTGCRIMVTLLHAMKKRGKTLGLATLCGGGGVSLACALEMM
jgi:acetyl-CoA C-acetyltransferase